MTKGTFWDEEEGVWKNYELGLQMSDSAYQSLKNHPEIIKRREESLDEYRRKYQYIHLDLIAYGALK